MCCLYVVVLFRYLVALSFLSVCHIPWGEPRHISSFFSSFLLRFVYWCLLFSLFHRMGMSCLSYVCPHIKPFILPAGIQHTTSAHADSSILALDMKKFSGHKTTPERSCMLCVVTYWYAVSTAVDNVCVLHVKPFFLPVHIQHKQCPYRSFNLINNREMKVLCSQNYAAESEISRCHVPGMHF